MKISIGTHNKKSVHIDLDILSSTRLLIQGDSGSGKSWLLRVLRYLANPEIPVLDPFGGTGTTARIAKNMGRKCVTIEYSEQWCEFIAKSRMAQMILL